MKKQPLVLLHGALGAASQFEGLGPLLGDHFELHAFDFEGHAGAGDSGRPFRMEHFVENTAAYIGKHGLAPARIFGYSMGGYVACLLAKTHPKMVKRIATLGTKFIWNPVVARKERGLLDPDTIEAKVPHFASMLDERHPHGWKSVVHKTAELLGDLGDHPRLTTDNWNSLELPVRVHVGDRDHTVSVEEAAEIYRALPRGELSVLPGTPHPLEKVSMERLSGALRDFLSAES